MPEMYGAYDQDTYITGGYIQMRWILLQGEKMIKDIKKKESLARKVSKYISKNPSISDDDGDVLNNNVKLK